MLPTKYMSRFAILELRLDWIVATKKDPEIIKFEKRQQKGLAEQEKLEKFLYEDWAHNAAAVSQEGHAPDDAEDATAYLSNPDIVALTSPMEANFWKVEVKVADIIKEGQIVAILEAMKMEVNVLAPKGSGDLVQMLWSRSWKSRKALRMQVIL